MSLFRQTQFDTRHLPQPAEPFRRARLWAERFRMLIEDMNVDFAEDDNHVYGRHRFVANDLVAVGEMDSSSFIGLRGRQHIRPDDDRHVYIGVNIGTTRTVLGQFGRCLVVEPGEAALAMMEASSTAIAPVGGRTLNLRIPSSAFADWQLAPEDLACRRLDTSRAEYRFLTGYGRLFVQEGSHFGAEQASHAARHLVDLVGLWLGSRGRPLASFDAKAGAEARRMVIRHLTDRHAAEPDFDLTRLSAKAGIPARTVQHLLSEVDLSFSQILAEARLRRARLMLMDPDCDALAVADLAFACGFLNVTSFYRAFRRRYGLTPSDMRQGRA